MIKRFYIAFVCWFCFAGVANAQHPPAWGGGADLNDFSFGFSFGYLSSYFKVSKQSSWRDPFFDPQNNARLTDELNAISSPNSSGFGVGFLARYSLTDHLEARVTPTLIFADKKIDYLYRNSNPDKQNVTKQVNTTAFDIPLLLKLKSDRIGDLRGYLIGGVKITQALGRKNPDAEKGLLEKVVKIQSNFASYEFGAGMDIYFEFFKMSPEIKISNSFGSVLVQENHPYSRPLTGLRQHTIQFSLYFE